MIFISKSEESLKLTQDTFKAKFNLLSHSLKFFLAVATVLITFSVFTTGTLRKAILLEVIVEGVNMIPIEFVYLYGLQFTIVLVIFCLPIYFQLRIKGQDIINSSKNEPEPNEPAIKNMELFMQESVVDTFKVGFAILEPLISSILPDVLNF